MSSGSEWTDLVWDDPNGGKIILHGTLPTVVYPHGMWPRDGWHGLALLEPADVVELWQEEEADEAESPGLNLSHALLSGGIFGKYLEGITMLDDLQGGRFPDPEPRRLQRNASRHERPVFFVEPSVNDADWNAYLIEEAKQVSHWKTLLSMIRINKRWKKGVRHHLAQIPTLPKGVAEDYATASILAAAWWKLSEDMRTPALNLKRDQRYAARLRGALAHLRVDHGQDAHLLVALHHPHMHALLLTLQAGVEPEEISSTTTAPHLLEEE